MAMNNSDQNEDVDEKMINIKSDEEIIHESDVQDIINMMKEDLDQVKLVTKTDEASLNEVESPKSSRKFNENVENDKSSNTAYTYRSATNETSNSQSRTQKYFEIDRACCENPSCADCVGTEELDEYEEEFSVDESDAKYAEVVEFIEKAKQFGANALDLSKKNLCRIPRNLMDLKHLQYIYLEGNSLTKLPKNFFRIFQELRWLDVSIYSYIISRIAIVSSSSFKADLQFDCFLNKIFSKSIILMDL